MPDNKVAINSVVLMTAGGIDEAAKKKRVYRAPGE